MIREYVQRMAATVGRKAGAPEVWVPEGLPEAEGACLGVLRSDFKGTGQASSVALSRDGYRLFAGTPDGITRCWDLTTAEVLWHHHEPHVGIHEHDDVNLSPNGKTLASLYWTKGRVVLLDATSGQAQHTLEIRTPWKSSWSPDSRLLAVSLPHQNEVVVIEAETGRALHRLEIKQPWGVDWSADGTLLAARGWRCLRIWQVSSWRPVEDIEVPDGVPVAWSCAGTTLAVAARDGSTTLFRREAWREPVTLPAADVGAVEDISFAADDRLLASGHGGGTVLIRELPGGEPLARFTRAEQGGPYDYDAWRLAWHPAGGFLAVAYADGTVRLWDTRPFLAGGSLVSRTVPVALAGLPDAMGRLAGLGIFAPPSLVRDLFDLLAGRRVASAVAALAGLPGVVALVRLGWPREARTGLVALLLQRVPLPDWAPPVGLTPARLQRALAEALAGEACEVLLVAPPLAALAAAAERVDDRLLRLLTLLGPAAVAREPGLPLRLLTELPGLAACPLVDRRLLGLRLSPGRGRASGRGPGSERVGVRGHGGPRDLLPGQLALPEPVFRMRVLSGSLLYRDRQGREPPRLRPTVLLLDVSPPVYGPVEALTRTAAHIVAHSLHEAGLPAALVLAGGPTRVRLLQQPSDLLACWTERSSQPADEAEALSQAADLAQHLSEGPVDPAVLLLSHTWFGADLTDPPIPPNLRALFITYPGESDHPPLARHCHHHKTQPANTPSNLAELLTELIG